MLHLLRRADQSGVEHGRFFQFVDHLFTLFEQALHAFAGPAAGLLADGFKNPFQTRDLFPGLLQVLLERRLQVVVAGRFHHLRQGVDDLFFGVV